eukprot:CAMPEP_0185040756 /NCGR_PEP_ID=MMETSP1103-20130426/39203_1 /TAXON_ID=36769 /ORGANISM="Paraphysomonas bandaiensis, Strain Caron Lab Isolate" /LENGTH=268 /DNA_ID=CAMNT_0027580173 /DNA_START=176 /DNA_END=983 /DNA_ORIENTATION=-
MRSRVTVSACESAGDIAAHLSECVHTQPPPVIVKTKRPVKRREKKSHSGRDVSAGEQKEAALTVAKDETEIGMTHTKSSVKHLRVVLPHNVPMLVLSNESGKNNEGHKNRGEIENGVDQNLQCPAEFSACTPTKCKQSMYLDMTDDTDDEDYSITTSRCSEVAATPKSSCDEAQTELEVPHVTPKLIYPSSLPSKPEEEGRFGIKIRPAIYTGHSVTLTDYVHVEVVDYPLCHWKEDGVSYKASQWTPMFQRQVLPKVMRSGTGPMVR